ncbi:hypothetical protein FGO68_gene10884 [Halteria grandinella]|uniref:Uncharacterized protein n=1 Tax=Halteria grandinella TaxID=5974 RepID=A0A8J8NY55_HALGN|nr:hypothetical protein FGO68_gene10884 [Halteria grandinella]
MDFYNEMEQSLVNGEIPKKYGVDIAKEFNFDEFNDKKYKADYLSLQIKFFDQLKYLSIKLKNLPLIDRMNHLKRKLEEINEWIKSNVRSQVDTITTQSKYNYNGVVLPFELGDDQDQSIILNIVPDLALAFDTKKRAPFRVVFETVKLSELRDGLFQQSETRLPDGEDSENLRGAGKAVNLDDREERPQMIVEHETQAKEAIIDNQTGRRRGKWPLTRESFCIIYFQGD